MVSSWRLKLCRAEQHLRDLKARVGPLRERRTYAVSEGFDQEGQARNWIRRVNFPEPADPMFQILAGELMFDARSALDHLACALVPVDQRTPKIIRHTQFPIFSCDPYDIDAATGKHLNPNEWSQWVRMTKGITDKAIPFLKGLQPYMFGPEKGPENHALAILNALQNADKHRELVVFANGLLNPVIRHTRPSGLVSYESQPSGLPADRVLRNGAVVDRAATNDLSDVNVEVEGTLQIVVSERGEDPHWPFPEVFEAMIRQARTAFDRLERFALS